MASQHHSDRTQARSGVFISYARSDGEAFATQLRQRLEAEDIPLWQDRAALEGGRDWWLQITEALDHVEFMVMVMTPGALRSETVRREWRYARQQGVCVYPVKTAPNLDFASLPRWMSSAHFYDLEREWTKFVNDLNTRCQAPRVPFMVEDLPPDFVARPEEMNQLLTHLLDSQREEPVAITAALRGAGGYGKTTLARALCHKEDVQTAFDDGILWVTLGESPGDLTGRVEDLIYTLTGERPGFAGQDAATHRLVELLADRDILLVLDDVWNRADLRPFVQGGPRCARLITTRNRDTLPPDTRPVDVDAMRQDEAVALLGAGLPHGQAPELRTLAARLGEWPLLLTLVNGALRDRLSRGEPLSNALVYVNRALDRRGLTFFDARDAKAREQAVAKTLGVSLEHLSEPERARYGELAVFPEDVDIPLATLTKLWGRTGALDEFDTEDLCERLNRLSLLLRFDLAARTIRLHDVVRHYLMHEQAEHLAALHNHLLDAHRPAPSPHWADLPTDEPYLWDHLAYHLLGAGRGDELVATVQDLRFLAVKTFVRQALAVETDLLAAEAQAPDDAALRLLRRNFVNSGHLLNRCEKLNDLKATLHSRLQHLSELAPLTQRLAQDISAPHLTAWHPLPDLPHPALVRTLSGHTLAVNGCAISADGNFIVSASWDGTLKVWDAQSGIERLTLSGHMGGVLGCVISPDGSFIVSASSDETLKVWDAQNGIERLTLAGHTAAVSGCAISTDGNFIVSASWDGTLKVWDAKSGAEHSTLTGHTDEVNDCAISTDGRFLVSASRDKTLKVWDAKSGAEHFTLTGHTAAVNGCAISANGSFIVSASSDKTLKAWDAHSGTERCTLSGHTHGVEDCAISPDSSSIVSASYSMMLKVWDVESGTERLTFTGHTHGVNGCAISPNGSFIVSASNDQKLKVWDAKSIANHHISLKYKKAAWGCAISPDGSFVVAASADSTLKVWNAQSGAERLILTGHTEGVNVCAISSDNSFIASASFDKTLKVWDAQSGAECFTLFGHNGWVNPCAVSADSSFIVSASQDMTLKVWDAMSGAERLTLAGHTMAVSGCAISADGDFIVSTSWDGTLKVWDVRSGAERLTLGDHLAGHTGVSGCAISADGSFIVSASQDGPLKVWDAMSGAERFTLTGHTVNDCAISADGSFIVSASEDNTLKVWDARSGDCVATFYTDGPLFDCAWSPDGEHIVAAGNAGVYFLRWVRA